MSSERRREEERKREDAHWHEHQLLEARAAAASKQAVSRQPRAPAGSRRRKHTEADALRSLMARCAEEERVRCSRCAKPPTDRGLRACVSVELTTVCAVRCARAGARAHRCAMRPCAT